MANLGCHAAAVETSASLDKSRHPLRNKGLATSPKYFALVSTTAALNLQIPFWKTQRLGASVSRFVCIWADKGYQGQDFMKWVMNRFRLILEVVKRSDDLSGFVVLPKCWIVERTFGWLNWNRRLSKNYEILTSTGEAFCYIAMIRIMLRRLADAS